MVTRHSLMMYAAKHWPAWQFRLLTRLVQSESWLRRVGAWWSGDTHQAGVFAALAAVCRDMRRGEAALARERIEHAVRRVDVRVGV